MPIPVGSGHAGAGVGLRPLAADGIPALGALAEEIWREAYAGLLAPGQIDHMLRLMYAPAVIAAELAAGVRWRLVDVDGAEAGFAAWGPVEDAMKLHKAYLRREARGRGALGAVLAAVAGDARAHGLHAIVLNVNKGNARAIAAYRKHGFAVAASVVADIGGGWVMDDHIMRLDLPDG